MIPRLKLQLRLSMLWNEYTAKNSLVKKLYSRPYGGKIPTKLNLNWLIRTDEMNNRLLKHGYDSHRELQVVNRAKYYDQVSIPFQ